MCCDGSVIVTALVPLMGAVGTAKRAVTVAVLDAVMIAVMGAVMITMLVRDSARIKCKLMYIMIFLTCEK